MMQVTQRTTDLEGITLEQPFDFAKEQKELYQPKTSPAVVEVPEMVFFAVDGAGNPNEQEGQYADAVQLLYALSYTVKMSDKGKQPLPGFFSYRVPPLEGLWQMAGGQPGVDYANKAGFEWTSMIRQPAFVDEAAFDWACAEVQRKKGLDPSRARLYRYYEGLCVQSLHIGPYDAEPATVARMDAFAAEQGFRLDFGARRHHELYLGDPRRTAPEKLKTIIRHPIAKK
jgi:hypothetical protein